MPADVRELADRVEVLVHRLEPHADAEELVHTLVTLYGEALSRIVGGVRASPGGECVVEALCGDEFVASVMIVHDLHPIPLETRIERALDGVRPYLRSHGGEVDVLRICDGVVDLKLRGTCDGCPSSSATLKLAVERAIRSAAPEVIEVRANTTTEDVRELPRVSTWTTLDEAGDIAPHTVAAAQIDGVALLLVRGPEQLYVYRDRCPVCKARLQRPTLHWPALRCSGCGEAYDVAHAGRSVTNGTHLEPLPLVTNGAGVRVAVPAGG